MTDYPKLCPLCGHPYLLHEFFDDWCIYCESVLAEDDLGTPICETPNSDVDEIRLALEKLARAPYDVETLKKIIVEWEKQWQ